MVKRKALDTVAVAARAKVGADDVASVDEHTVTAGVNMPKDLHALLRAVALKRAKEQGGRPSVSAIFVELCRQHQGELEKEAGRYLELIDLL